jgi:hypothetical protein
MTHLRLCLIAAMTAKIALHPAHCATHEIDVQQRRSGVSLAGINLAIDDARGIFRSQPNDTVIVQLPAGSFPMVPSGAQRSIDVSDVSPGPAGRLVVRGLGMAQTVLVFDSNASEIVGRNTSHVTFSGLHFTLARMTVSQGHVTALTPGTVDVQIQQGFPAPGDLIDDFSKPNGRYLRRCTDSRTDSHIIESEDNRQIFWREAQQISPGLWRLYLAKQRGGELHIGDFIAVKSKKGNSNAYRFMGGTDVTFDDVLWTRASRGVFRGGMSDVHILNSAIRRDPPVDGQSPCLSSAGGGPQIGQPNDPPTSGNVVRNFTAEGTGDDAVAFFNASGKIENATISGSFARGILLINSPDVVINSVHMDASPLLRH